MTIAISGIEPSEAYLYINDLIVIGCSEKYIINNPTSEVTFLEHKCTYKGILQDSKKYDRNFPICIKTDARKHVCGNVLTQLPIAYVSRSFRKEKSNKNATGQELADIPGAINHFRPYIYIIHCKFKRDHS